MKTRATRLAASAPDDTGALAAAIAQSSIDPTRAFATSTLRRLFAKQLKLPESEVEGRIAFVMSGGTEGR